MGFLRVFQIFFFLFLCDVWSFFVSSEGREGVEQNYLQIHMPNVIPSKDDDYICTYLNVEDKSTSYIKGFEPKSNADRAHHMILFTCDDLLEVKPFWECQHHYQACKTQRILYAWAKNAPPTLLPKDVGFWIGPDAGIKNIILQVHYAHPLPPGETDTSGFKIITTSVEPIYLAGIMILMSSHLTIPAHEEKVHADANCPLEKPRAIHPFAYRVHTHSLGTVVSGYHMPFKNQNSQYPNFTMIAKGNPQWPQAFYPIDHPITIEPSDFVLARCTFNNTKNNDVKIGMTAGDEMCNLYLMFYTDSRDPEDHFIPCMDTGYTGMNLNLYLPPGNDVPLPRNESLEEHAKGHDMSHGHGEIVNKKKNHAKKRPGIAMENYSEDSLAFGDPEYETNRVGYDRKISSTPSYEVVQNWPSGGVELGQATGVALDVQGNVVVFHRGTQVWNGESFDNQNRFRQASQGPIQQHTVLVFNSITGKLLHQWGENMFYMPHGITIGENGDTFLTDVAMHQVFKFSPGSWNASLVLGERFVPGKDNFHFCKPTSVAISANGDFFVADGYCNSRIMKFDSNGKFLLQFGRANGFINYLFSPPSYAFSIPHAMAISHKDQLLFVADRENGRIQVFNSTTAKFAYSITSPYFGGKIYSVAYSPAKGGTLYAVNGKSMLPKVLSGFVIPLSLRTPTSMFAPSPSGFGMPHDIIASADGEQVYVVGIEMPFKVWKFKLKTESSIGRTGKGDEHVIEHTSTPIISSQDPKDPKDPLKKIPNFEEGFSASVVIMAFLTIPILCCVGIGAICKLRNSYCCRKGKETTKSFSEFFPPSAGFEKLRMDESGSESDTEVEEFTVESYRKTSA